MGIYIKSNINVRKTPTSRTMNLKLCKFPRVLTRFRLVQRQSATVTAHTCAQSWHSPFNYAWLITFTETKFSFVRTALKPLKKPQNISLLLLVDLICFCFVLFCFFPKKLKNVLGDNSDSYAQCNLSGHTRSGQIKINNAQCPTGISG